MGKIYNGKSFLWYFFEGAAEVKTPPIPPAASGVVLQKGDLMVYSRHPVGLSTLVWVWTDGLANIGKGRSVHRQNGWKQVDGGFSLEMDDKPYVLKLGKNGKPRWVTRETIARSLRQ